MDLTTVCTVLLLLPLDSGGPDVLKQHILWNLKTQFFVLFLASDLQCDLIIYSNSLIVATKADYSDSYKLWWVKCRSMVVEETSHLVQIL